jgi:predicted pyridoxine 5'-phosphate oxidase superfamily flavin-nucleotide-binding protein
VAMFHDENRALQDRFGSRALADRLVETRHRTAFTAEDAASIAACPFFFLATADADGRPDCSFKGGDPGFVRVLAPDLLAFPDYDGNGMFKSLGNIRANPAVGLLFMAFVPAATPQSRLRVNGTAEVAAENDPQLREFVGGQLLVRVRPSHIFPNCPRYIPDLAGKALSPYTPRPGAAPLEPEWKSRAVLRDVVVPRRG